MGTYVDDYNAVRRLGGGIEYIKSTETLQDDWNKFLAGGSSGPATSDDPGGVFEPTAPATGGDDIIEIVVDDDSYEWAYYIPYIDATFNDSGTISANYFDIIPDVVWMSFVDGDSTAGLANPNDVEIYAQISEDNEFIDYNKLTEQENINGSFPFVIESVTLADSITNNYNVKYVAIMSLGAVSGIPYYTDYSPGNEIFYIKQRWTF